MQIQLSEPEIKGILAAIDGSRLDLAGSVALDKLQKAIVSGSPGDCVSPKKNTPEWHWWQSK